MQKTDFPIEIIVHDDASTDSTAFIIGEYQSKYPDLIKPILQTKNQYSQGKKIFPITFQQAQGKYIALCEGDDYWTDPLKLQKQVDFLEANPEYMMVAHPAQVLKEGTDKLIDGDGIGYIKNHEEQSRDWSVLEWPEFRLPTASLLFNTKVSQKYHQIMSNGHSSDMCIVYTAASLGKIRCLPNSMSVYRINDQGVWSNGTRIFKRLFFIKSVDAIVASNLAEETGAMDWLKTLFDHLVFQLALNFDDSYQFWDVLNKNLTCDIEKLSRNKWIITTSCDAVIKQNKLITDLQDSQSFKVGNLIVTLLKKILFR